MSRAFANLSLPKQSLICILASRHGTDRTHLNTEGSLVFGIIVADLITRRNGPYPKLRKYFDLDPGVVYDLTHGIYWYPATCSGDFCGSE